MARWGWLAAVRMIARTTQRSNQVEGPTEQTQAKLEHSLKGKGKSDGEDVLTPLIQQAANSILTM